LCSVRYTAFENKFAEHAEKSFSGSSGSTPSKNPWRIGNKNQEREMNRNQQVKNDGTKKKGKQAETGTEREHAALMARLAAFFGAMFLLVLIYAMIGDNTDLVAQAFKVVKYGLFVAVAWAGGSRLRRRQ
jgi:hypothetical protein